MYLKELTLRGFKSFASSTTLRFGPGITAVVGPNGSGKSNIVDALTWVMGEQGARNLRGSSMEDVIFAGTASRPQLGRAQVSLTIDNTDHALDIDYSEVTITRTIFRNGGSEYAINGSQCRLLDVQELLSDAGLGSQMHVIVGQGRLDAILRADPAGHRAFIEEAAGILKHRRRKERALRKLAATERNLARLDDLLGEIHRQMGPLGRQARTSRRADAIQIGLRDARTRLYADDAVRLNAARERVRAELSDVRGGLADAQRNLADVKVRIGRAEEAVRRTSPAIAGLTSVWHDMGQTRERLRALASLADERRRSLLGQVVEAGGEDPDLLRARAVELDGMAERQQAAVRDQRLRLDKVIEARVDAERRLKSLRATMAELRRTAQERENRMAELNTLIAREEALAQSSDTRFADHAARLDQVLGQMDEAERRLAALRSETGDVDDADDGAALDEARRALARARDEADALDGRRRDLDNRIVALRAKADALGDALGGHGDGKGLEQDGTIAVLGRLADFIRVADGWEEAVGRALGVFADATVVADGDSLLRALRHARRDAQGRAVVLDASARGHGADPRGDAPRETGSCLRAARLVEARPGVDGADAVTASVRLLLRDVCAVETLDDVPAAVERGWRRIVTRDGEVVADGVAASGGSALPHSDLSLTARRDKALAEAGALAGDLRNAETALADARRRSGEAAERVRREQDALAERRMRARQAESALKAATDRVASLKAEAERLRSLADDIDRERSAHRRKADELHEALRAVPSPSDGLPDGDDPADRERETERRLSELRNEETSASVRLFEATRQTESYERQAKLLRDDAGRAEQRRRRIEELNERRRTQADTAGRIAETARSLAGSLTSRIETVERERGDAQRAASLHDNELASLRERRDGLEPEVERLMRREHELDVERERLATEYDQLSKRISDELGMTYDEVADGYGPDRPVPVLDDDGNVRGGDGGEPRTVPYVREEQLKRLEKAKRDLARLGRINPLATEEFDALQARNRFLNDQRDDVAKSRDDLMTLIRQLDATMTDVFAKAFADVAAAFERMFSLLFPGGHGTLKLEDPDDMLSTGVLVQARPAGKRVRQLSLLSGGERSLTALAFLFAIFTARPSPFYVLDEVEAALDDVNLTRLLNAFEDLRDHAQLIVITHQQRTMGIADALYGVTMRADGVTAVVSQRLA